MCGMQEGNPAPALLIILGGNRNRFGERRGMPPKINLPKKAVLAEQVTDPPEPTALSSR